MAQALQSDVQAHADEAVGYLQELLRIDTTNPPGNETEAAKYLAGILRREGYDPTVVESAPGRGNVVVRYRGTGEREPLLIYGHLDVVMAEPKRWTREPFSGAVEDGCVWGRGALDMKSMVAQELMIMLLLQRSGARLTRDVIFAATADEEAGGKAGMGFLAESHPDLIRAEYALSEGGGTTMYIGGKAFYDVRTAEKGTCRFTLRASGEPGHGSRPKPETSVSKLAQAVLRLTTTALPFHRTVTSARFFEVVCSALLVPPDRRQLTEQNVQRVMQMLPADMGSYLHAITRDTAVPTGLRAGHKINVIPSEAEAWVDGRYLPGQTAESFLNEVRKVVGKDYEIEGIDMTLPLEDPPEGPLYETVGAVMRRHAPDAALIPIMLAGATDAKHVARLGAGCLGFGPIRVPQGFPAEQLIHGHDERVPLEGYLWGLQVLHDIVLEFCS
jgi:acetylornithine deacetylase/succinyl-diaminopimelate desuccinylase-like protein